MSRALAASDEDDVALTGIDVVIFQDEELVDTIFLKCSNLDYQANGANQAAVEDDILLSSYLENRGVNIEPSQKTGAVSGSRCYLHLQAGTEASFVLYSAHYLC